MWETGLHPTYFVYCGIKKDTLRRFPLVSDCLKIVILSNREACKYYKQQVKFYCISTNAHTLVQTAHTQCRKKLIGINK